MVKTVQTDAQGRLNLGKEFASSTFLIEVVDDEDILLKKAVIIPERELKLLKDPESLKKVRKGIKEAKNHQLHVMDPTEFDE